MKKYVIKATALAIGALAGGAAVASVDFSASPFVATTDVFASELNYSDSPAVPTPITGGKTVTTKLGFGVSASQNRYIRIDVTGAKLSAVQAMLALTTFRAFRLMLTSPWCRAVRLTIRLSSIK